MPRTVPDVVPAGTIRDLQQPVFEPTPELIVRAWLPSDATALVEAFSNPAIQRWHTRVFDSIAEAEAWAARWERLWNEETDASWAVTDRETGGLRGYVALRGIDLEAGFAFVAYWTVEAARGRGIAPTAAELMIGWAFQALGLHRLEIRHVVENDASCRVASKLGFAFEGTNNSVELLTDGWHDMHVHARIAPAP
jgi:RimJ/RimL family protein N-acetyltransferase